MTAFRRDSRWVADADPVNNPSEQLDAVSRWSARVAEHEREEKVERLKRLARSKAGDEAAKRALELHKKSEAEQKERQTMSNALAAFTAPKKKKVSHCLFARALHTVPLTRTPCAQQVDERKFTLPPSAAAKAPPTWNKGGSCVIYVKKEPGVGDSAAAAPTAAAAPATAYITMRDFEYYLENAAQFSKSETLFQTLAK